MTKQPKPLPRVVVGQVWRDRDPRMSRHIRIESVVGDKAHVQRCAEDGIVRQSSSKHAKIAVRRFVSNSTGFDLVRDA